MRFSYERLDAMEELLLLPSADMSTQASEKPSEAPRSVSVAGAPERPQ